ncbi:Vps62-related protein [Pyxidicoccus fallax]|uniref:Vps62-related protein n=1 Tax=Pyxidicoccus fallax TaxID=394095 RepID=A0A848LEE6_9BACT|nr:Vps62-related protein [Pyxidicoccus fallax]NMO16826.1 Vps62-related protein [Pyxidicoccus fallax]NPC77567.1 Vps62-related protein [Pyxidicoccus fallax]
MSLPPVIEFSTTSKFTRVWWDKGSGATMDGAFYRPIPREGFFILGDYGQGNYLEPTGTVLTIRVVDNDDPKNPALVAPEDYRLIYKDKGSGADEDGSFWAPVPPFGYVACGHVIQRGYDKPYIPNYRCLRHDLAAAVGLGGLIWDDRGSGADMNVSIYRVNQLNVFYAIPSFSPPTEGTFVPSVLVTP